MHCRRRTEYQSSQLQKWLEIIKSGFNRVRVKSLTCWQKTKLRLFTLSTEHILEISNIEAFRKLHKETWRTVMWQPSLNDAAKSALIVSPASAPHRHECSSASPWEQEAEFSAGALMSGRRLRGVQRARRRGEEPREWAKDGAGGDDMGRIPANSSGNNKETLNKDAR